MDFILPDHATVPGKRMDPPVIGTGVIVPPENLSYWNAPDESEPSNHSVPVLPS